MRRREFIYAALLGGGSTSDFLMCDPPPAQQYLWGTRNGDGTYTVRPKGGWFTVVVVDTVMARRMQPGDHCLLRQRSYGWEVVMRHQEGR